MQQKKQRRQYYYFLSLALMLLIIFSAASSAEAKEDKFLIIHLDAVSSIDFFKELEEGRLPNTAELFASGQQSRYGLTLYPGGTEMIYPRLKEGLDNSQKSLIGWGFLERETGRKIRDIPIFLELVSSFSRRNRHQFLLGFPVLTNLAGLSLLNIERLWETQDVVEFFWFHTDVMGHLLGRDHHLKSLRRFDYFLGLAAKSGRLDGANVILYTDHGMTTEDVEVVYHKRVILDALGSRIKFLAYPNIYLYNPEDKVELARQMAKEAELDLALVKISKDVIRGYSSGGSFEVSRSGDRYLYSFLGSDYFGYLEAGCADVYLSKEEWLQHTKDHLYPAAPPNLFGYLSNPSVGDIVIVIDSPRIPFAFRAQRGNHAGLKNTDLLVPLLFAGPAFAEKEAPGVFWLHELYSKHFPQLDFKSRRRERHAFSISYPFRAEVVFSPFYRWRCGLTIQGQKAEPWLECDLYSSFLTRVWGGLRITENRLDWQLKVDAFLGNVAVSWLKRQGRNGKFSVDLRLNEQVELNIGAGWAGVSILF
ncbi:MAG: alkaline phosphatase family protein [Firmicutes bacterium]|nr:alkaline phosphatase family protein [Bacillota bacterium]